MLYKKYRIISNIKFKRKLRYECERKSFCCYESNLCYFYTTLHVEESTRQSCVFISLGSPYNKIHGSLYGVCSYINRIQSIYIYAPEKII